MGRSAAAINRLPSPLLLCGPQQTAAAAPETWAESELPKEAYCVPLSQPWAGAPARRSLASWNLQRRSLRKQGNVGVQYATGDRWRNNSRKNEGIEPKQKQYPVVDVTGDRSKV